MTTFDIRLIARGDTEANWVASNPVLRKGEVAITYGVDDEIVGVKIGINQTWSDTGYWDKHIIGKWIESSESVIFVYNGITGTYNFEVVTTDVSEDGSELPFSSSGAFRIENKLNKTTKIYNTLAERDADTDLSLTLYGFVRDATGDPQATLTHALYFRVGGGWYIIGPVGTGVPTIPDNAIILNDNQALVLNDEEYLITN